MASSMHFDLMVEPEGSRGEPWEVLGKRNSVTGPVSVPRTDWSRA